jgi:Ca2+-transporting ATPase
MSGATVDEASKGLSSVEAAERLRVEGPNELPSARPRSATAIAVDVLREPMLLLLVATGAIYLVLGDLGEALAMVGAILVVLGITFFQERKTERTLHALRDLSSPRALVLRDGSPQRIPGRNVVRGDLLILKEGDRVAADASIADAAALTVDESLLTGESAAVLKRAGTTTTEPPSQFDEAHVYSGTLVVNGHGTARVVATGAGTALGRIGTSLASLQVGSTPLQQEVRRVVRLLAFLGLSACLAVVLLYGIGRGEWLRGALAGLTMAISMVPEEFPLILTIFVALGAWRISQQHVLTRRLPAIEALGAATVLCVDKTGTLTLNQMSVAGVDVDGRFHEFREGPDPDVAEVLAFGHLASEAQPIDPIDLAFARVAATGRTAAGQDGWTRAREYPLSADLLVAANGWITNGGRRIVAAKGAPEAVAQLCRFDAAELQRVHERVTRLANDGMRILGVARVEVKTDFPDSLSAPTFSFMGLVAFRDPVRPIVPAAIAECRSAGIRVVMLTGDYPVTALAVARAIDLDTSAGALTGGEIASMDDEDLARAVRNVNVFARMVPEQKLRLVHALRDAGEVVAMTGDGVNDAPALKAAHIGVAMGLRGTDVAREAGALVLLDDDFSSIVAAVRLGRRIYDNIRKATGYVLAIHVPIAGMSLLPPLLEWPLVLMPLHVIFMELIVDPACSIAFEMEPEEGNVMARPPRRPGERLFDRLLVWRSVLEGSTMLLVAFLVYAGARWSGMDEGDIRTLTFITLIVSNLMLILANRSLTTALASTWRTANPALWYVVGGALTALAAVLFVPTLRDVFNLSRPHLIDLAVCAGAAAAAFAGMELLKFATRRKAA